MPEDWSLFNRLRALFLRYASHHEAWACGVGLPRHRLCRVGNIESVCRVGEGTCADITVDCGDGEACPDGYECRVVSALRDGEIVSVGEFCVCASDGDACRASCGVDDDCPAGTACDQPRGPGEGTCNDDIAFCLGNYDCLPGQRCEWNQRIGEDICTSTGDKPLGADCDDDIACASGICDDGICTDDCHSDADCDSGEFCTGTGAWYGTDGCSAGDCPITCPDDTVCSARDERCEPAFCRLTSDCAEGDCVNSPADPRMGRCISSDPTDTTNLCKPNEFRIWDEDPFCRLPGPCESGTDECPGGYACESVVARFPRIATPFCSRRVVAQ